MSPPDSRTSNSGRRSAALWCALSRPAAAPRSRRLVDRTASQVRRPSADLSRGFFGVFGQTELSVRTGTTLAAYNLDRGRSLRAKQAENEAKPLGAQRRTGNAGQIGSRGTSIPRQ